MFMLMLGYKQLVLSIDEVLILHKNIPYNVHVYLYEFFFYISLVYKLDKIHLTNQW
jgi:hypothetical protein